MQRPKQADGRVHGVIIGCRDDRRRWLLIRRGERVAAPLQVCFPGGAVEPGEDRDAAAVREMHEELGIEVKLHGLVWRHDFEDRELTLWGYLGSFNGDAMRPDPQEVSEVLWLTADEVRKHPDAMPRTEAFVRALEEAVSKSDG
jgi:8-oxo-dGTP pyrophosphatase MutT (NUDIX family)